MALSIIQLDQLNVKQLERVVAKESKEINKLIEAAERTLGGNAKYSMELFEAKHKGAKKYRYRQTGRYRVVRNDSKTGLIGQYHALQKAKTVLTQQSKQSLVKNARTISKKYKATKSQLPLFKFLDAEVGKKYRALRPEDYDEEASVIDE